MWNSTGRLPLSYNSDDEDAEYKVKQVINSEWCVRNAKIRIIKIVDIFKHTLILTKCLALCMFKLTDVYYIYLMLIILPLRCFYVFYVLQNCDQEAFVHNNVSLIKLY